MSRSTTFDELEYFTEESLDNCERCGSKTCYGERECSLHDDVYIDE